MDTLGNRDGDQTLTEGTVNFVVDDDTNRYTSVGGNAVSHDAAGNMTVHTRNGTEYTNHYDYENRLLKITEPDGPDPGSEPDVVAEMDYDALGELDNVFLAIIPFTLVFAVIITANRMTCILSNSPSYYGCLG